MNENNDPGLLKGFSPFQQKVFHRYFSMVANRHGWKKPINTTIKLDESEFNILKKAIHLYTGSRDIIIEAINGEYRVTAEGFYNVYGDI